MARRRSELDDVYQFVKDYLKTNHLSPSLREIAEGCYLHLSTARRYVDMLVIEGRLERTRGKARTIRLASRKRETNVRLM